MQEEASTDDPMHILKYHLIAKRRKLVHYFRSQRIGGEGVIGKDDFKEGLKVLGNFLLSLLDIISVWEFITW